MKKIKKNDEVRPKTQAGLWLADVPTDGTHKQKRQSVCVFKGKGTVLEVNDVVIDYDSWGDDYQKIGKVKVRNCLVKCSAGVGWAGEGALILES